MKRLVRGLTCTTTTDVISIYGKENNCTDYDVLPLLLEFEDAEPINQY